MVPGTQQSNEKKFRFVLQHQKLQHVMHWAHMIVQFINLFLTTQSLISLGLNHLAMTTGLCK